MTTRRVYIFLLIGLVLITLAWWFLFMAPKNRAIGEANDEIDAILTERTFLEDRRDELQRLRENEGAYQLGILELENSIPTFPDEAALIELIHDHADASGVMLFSLNPVPPSVVAGIDGLQQINMSMTIEGQYFEVLAFLAALEAEERLIRVDSVSLSSSLDPDTGRNLLNVSLNGTAFSKLGLATATVSSGEEGS